MGYDANTIQIRDFRTACRATPGMYIGADSTDAAYNCFLEILNNACDEAIMGRGNVITIEVSENELTCSDKGAGVPVGKNKDCEEVLIGIYTSAHSSGKFSQSSAYSRVRGCHGIGSSAVCVCSELFEVWTKREGAKWYMSFKDGIPQFPVARRIENTTETGTTVHFIPDKKIFHIPDDEPAFDLMRIRDELELTSYFIPRVTFVLKTEYGEEKFYSENGLKDFATSRINNNIHDGIIYNIAHFEENIDIEVFAQWTSGKEKNYVFSNGALNISGGTPIAGMKTAFSRSINTLSGKNFNSDAIRKGLVTIINIKHPAPIYQNQIKDKIQNSELRGYTQTAFTEAIKNWKMKYPGDFEKIITILSKEQKADEAAERAREAILNHEKKEQTARKKKIMMPEKFKDCEKHGEDSTLYIVEGNSALAGLNPGRNVEHDALYAIRGKILNCLKSPIDDALKNQEISDIITLLGCGILEKYNNNKLNYGKVAVASDGDVDGMNIMCLIATMFTVLMPNFISEGRLCWLKAPLYRVGVRGKRYYAYSIDELAEYKKKFPGAEIGRYKGLGEMRPEDVEESMFHEENRRLEVLKITDFENAYNVVNLLMGKEVSPRRDFLFENVDFSLLNR